MKITEPKSFIQGERLQWTRRFDNLTDGDGWTLKYYFRGAGSGFDAVAAIAGYDFVVTVPTATTAAMAVGKYAWQLFAEKAGERELLDAGTVEVKAGLAAVGVGETFDALTQAEKDLAAVRAMLSGKATKDVQEYSISNRQLRHILIPDLLALEKRLVFRVQKERQAARIQKGGKFFKQVLVRLK